MEAPGDRSAEAAGAPELVVDWAAIAGSMRAAIGRQLRDHHDAAIPDLVQEALAQLIPYLRRQHVESVEGLAVTIARRKAIEYVRHKRLERLIFLHLDELSARIPDQRSPAPDRLVQLREMRFLVRSILGRHAPRDLPLWLAYLRGQDWDAVAKALGVSGGAVRQRWSRCRKLLRRELDRDSQIQG